MRYLQLNKGYITLVDDDIYEMVSSYKWYALIAGNNTYAVRACKDLRYKDSYPFNGRLHHFVIGFPLPNFEVDHIDGNGLNNQRVNLRVIYKYQNPQNRNHNRTSIYPGVSWAQDRHMWRSCINIDKKTVKIGSYNTELEAFTAYRDAINTAGKELLPEYELLWKLSQ